MPRRILLQRITPRPVHAEHINRQPHHPIKVPLQLGLGIHVGHVAIPRLQIHPRVAAEKMMLEITLNRHSPIQTFSNSGVMESKPWEYPKTR